MDFDAILNQVGSWDTYQKRIFFFYFLPMSFIVAFRINYVFILDVPDHFCAISMNEKLNITEDQWKETVLVKAPLDSDYELCLQYDFDFESIHSVSELNQLNMGELNVTACEGVWSYDEQDFIETIPSLNNWVCDRARYASIVLTVGSVATLTGSLLYAYLSDTWLGRKRASFIQIIPTIVGGIATLFNPPFLVYCFCHFLTMLIFPSIYQVSLVLVAEQSSKEKRVLINTTSFFFWTLGLCASAFTAWILHGYWFYIILVELIFYIPLMSTYRLVYESPRYLLSRRKYDEAEKVLASIAKVNKKPVPINLKEMLVSLEHQPESKASLYKLFSTPKLTYRTVTMSIIWLTCGVTYFGLQMSVSNQDENVFLRHFFLSAVDIISFLLGTLSMNMIGRRASQSTFLLLTSVICCIIAALPHNEPHLIILLSQIIAKISVAVNFIITYQQGLELFPTVVRTLGIGIGSASSQGFSMLSPAILQVGFTWESFPYIVFGVIMAVSFALSLFLPETYNRALPETIKDADCIGNNQRFFSLNLKKLTNNL